MEIRLIGDSTILRSVRPDDAEYIARLRSDPRIYQYLSSNRELKTEEQRAWIMDHMKQRDSFYFTIEDLGSGDKSGTASIYNVDRDEGSAEFGRYIATHPIHAVETEFMILQLAFEVMSLRKLYCRTMDSNTKVWKQHLRFGFSDVGFEDFQGRSGALRRQEITFGEYLAFDYSGILGLLHRFASK